jgi:hypothetical protein
MNADNKNLIGKAVIGFLLALSAVSILTTTAEARTFFSLRVGVPLYAGPAYYPAYYGPYPYYQPAYASVYYAPPPVVVVPVTPVVASCRNGLWRQQDGSVVNGLACLQPNGVWQLAN